MVAVQDERIPGVRRRLGGRLGRLSEASLGGVDLEGLRNFGPRFLHGARGRPPLGVQARRIRAHGLPRVPLAQQMFQRRAQVEHIRIADRNQLVPLQRHRHRGPGAAANAVRRDDSLGGPVAVNIHQHPSLALFLLDVKRRRVAMRLHKGLCCCRCRLENLIEPPLRLDGRDDVHALSSSRLDERMVTEALDVRPEIQRYFDHALERKILRRVQVKNDVIRPVKMRGPAMHLMDFYARQICEPDKGCLFGRQDVVDLLFDPEGYMVDPFRRPILPVLLEERLAGNPVGVADKGKRAAFDVPEQCGSDFQVVFDKLRFDDPVVRKQNLLEIRKLYVALSYFDRSRRSGHSAILTQRLKGAKNHSVFRSLERRKDWPRI